jgi:hypothetical protein
MDAIRFLETENRAGIGMIQLCEYLRLAPEPCEAVWIPGENVGKNLERDAPIQSGIVRAIHLAHAARADDLADFIDAEPTTEASAIRCAVNYTRGTRTN